MKQLHRLIFIKCVEGFSFELLNNAVINAKHNNLVIRRKPRHDDGFFIKDLLYTLLPECATVSAIAIFPVKFLGY